MNLNGMLVTNASFNFTNLNNNIITSFSDVSTLIGYALLGALVVGIIAIIYFILIGGE